MPRGVFVHCLVAATKQVDYVPHPYPLPVETEGFVAVVGYKAKVFLRG